MVFKQLFEPNSCTYTYLIGCSNTGLAALIDPVLDSYERDLQVIKDQGLQLALTLDTHVHADHLTGAKKLRNLTGCQIGYPAMLNLECIDIGIREGVPVKVGDLELMPLYTPGHTDHHHAYLFDSGAQQLLFSGDALLIDGCGRTDFQSGDAKSLYQSIHEKFFSLPDETLVYPGHDYEGRFVSSIAQEKQRNSRLGGGRSEREFVKIMDELELTAPRKMVFAVPGNMECGQCPDNMPPGLSRICDPRDQG